MSSVLKRSEIAPLPAWLLRWAPQWSRRRDRGARADHPAAIPPAGWLDIGVRTARAAAAHDLITTAAGVTFFAMLAFIPALSAAAALYGLWAGASTGLRQASALEGIVPTDALALIDAELRRAAQTPRPQLFWTSVVGLIAAIGSVNAAVTALMSGLNRVYEEEECRGFWRKGLTAGLFTAGVATLVPLTFTSLLIGRGMADHVILSAEILGACRFVFLAFIATASLALIYRYGPCRDLARWRWVTPGGIFASLCWMVGSSAVTHYLAHFAHYRQTYGIMGAMLAVMVWLFTASAVALLGAEVNAQVETQTDRETRAEPAD